MSEVDLGLATSVLMEANSLIEQRNYARAREILTSTPEWVRATDPELDNTLLICCLHLQENQEGLRISDSVISLSLQRGSDRVLRQAMLRKSLFLMRAGKLLEAEACLRSSMEGKDWATSSKFVASANNALGIIGAARGAWDNAIPHLKRALAQFQTLGNIHGVAAVNHNLGLSYRHRGNFTIAERFFEAASEYFDAHGIPHEKIFSEAERSLAVLGRGDSMRAEAMARMSLEKCRVLNNAELLGEVLRILGTILAQRKLHDEALKVLNEARLLGSSANRDQLVAEVDEQLGLTYRSVGETDEALQYFAASKRYYENIDGSYFVKRLNRLIDTVGG